MTSSSTDVSALIEGQILRHVDGGWYRFNGLAQAVSARQPDAAAAQNAPTAADAAVGVALVGMAKHSEDQSAVAVCVVAGRSQWQAVLLGEKRQQDTGTLVVYEHLWPFEAGTWVRPVEEFGSRFTPAQTSALEAAMTQPREDAQAQVAATKAARRQAAAQG